MYRQFNAKINLNTLIMHNSRLADPRNSYAKAMKEISGKRKKTDADFEALADLEYEGGLYVNQSNDVVLPGRIVEAALLNGAKKSREGQSCLAAVFVDNDAIISYEGGPLSVKELLASPDHRLCVPVSIQRNKVMRTRPIFRNVEATVQISLDTTLANPEQLQKWLEATLNQCGLGDWRPRHGRGELLSFAEVKQTVKAVA